VYEQQLRRRLLLRLRFMRRLPELRHGELRGRHRGRQPVLRPVRLRWDDLGLPHELHEQRELRDRWLLQRLGLRGEALERLGVRQW
jgi:hypothetical protein